MKKIISTLSLLMLVMACAPKRKPLEHETTITIGEQFVREDLRYRPGVHKGFGQYRAKSLFGSKRIVLTYDDGPHPTYTPKLLDVLKKYDVTATFFVLGRNVNSKTKPIIQRMVKEGHIVATHTITHKNANKQSESEFKRELRESIERVKRYGYDQREIYFRFPYGAYGTNPNYHHFNSILSLSREMFGENCINFAFWDIDTSDWYSKKFKDGAQRIYSTTVAYLMGGTAYNHWRQGKPETISKANSLGGGVVLMHDLNQKVVDATDMLLSKLHQEGFQVVPMSEVEEYEFGNNKVCELN